MAEPPRNRGERYARALRQELGLGNGDHPLDIAGLIERRPAVDLVVRDFGESGGDGLYVWNDAQGHGVIIVNSANPPGRQRFIAAHELGHHELHRYDAPAMLIADEDVAQLGEDPAEQAADAFAAYLLAPTEAVLAGCADEPDAASACRLAAMFGLEAEAMIRRLREVGRIDRGGERALRNELADRAANPELDGAVPPPLREGLPSHYRRRALTLYARGSISEERLADLLSTDVEDALAQVAAAGVVRTEELESDERALSEFFED